MDIRTIIEINQAEIDWGYLLQEIKTLAKYWKNLQYWKRLKG